MFLLFVSRCYCFLCVIFSTGTSDPYCIVKVDNEVVARQVIIFFIFFLIPSKDAHVFV